MYTTQLDNGTFNNYAVEVPVTYEEYPTVYEQRRYIIQGLIAAFFVTATIVTAFVVS